MATEPFYRREGFVAELAIVVFGVVLRLSMWKTYRVMSGYDATSHIPYIDWFATHGFTLPPLSLCREAYHPPVYYFIAGKLHALGVGWQGLAGISIMSGIAKLAIVWWACRRYLAAYPLGRLVALGLLVVLPSALHLEGMLSAEGLSNLFAVVAMLLLPRAFGEHRWRPALFLGVILGLHILTKVSALALVGAIGTAALTELWFSRRWRQFLPLVAGLAVLISIVSPYAIRNQRQYGQTFLSGFDGLDAAQARVALIHPYLDRRSVGYYIGWTTLIYETPYLPSAIFPQSRFFPALLASTFVDSFNYGFTAIPKKGDPAVLGNYTPLRRQALTWARLSVAGGTVVMLVTLCAWWVVIRAAFRRRDYGLLAILLCPLMALLGQLHFATQYAVDSQGPVKGVYMQFAVAPLFLLFGVGVDWLWRRHRHGKAIAVLSIASVFCIAGYTVYSRLISPFF